MNRLTLLWRCIAGPSLYTRYIPKPPGAHALEDHNHEHRQNSIDYEPYRLEAITNTAISGTMFVLRLMYTLWPILLPIMYRRGYFTRDGGLYLSKTALACLIFFLPVFFLRGLSRYFNEDYIRFINVLAKTHSKKGTGTHSLTENLEQLRLFDFEFSDWPVDYVISKEIVERNPHLFQIREEKLVWAGQYWLNSLFANVLGVRMIYPGCTGLINAMVSPQLTIERTKWISERGGRRFKLRTPLGDEIDTCFVDKRNKEDNGNGNILVICSEGNAGFWEVGSFTTPHPLGYSLLGWNHPGFAGSSGWPFPANDRAAIASVYHFATSELGFSSKDIVLYSWSIGGYTSSWLASVVDPPVRAVILDATFNNIENLARRQMPVILHSLVLSTIKTHFDLDVAKHVRAYPGPVLFIRRTRDEIISLVPGHLATNCGNPLIVETLQHRYPALVPKIDLENFDRSGNNNFNVSDVETVEKLYEWLSEPLEVQSMLNFKDRSDCRDYIKSFAEKMEQSKELRGEHLGADTPLEFRRKLLAYVLLNCVKDFNATHCAPLPEEFFRIPASLLQ